MPGWVPEWEAEEEELTLTTSMADALLGMLDSDLMLLLLLLQSLG
jgi:hypothetical protein